MASQPQASIKDVAERAGVALGTVSNVLNRPEKVAGATRQRVLGAIEELGFVRNDAARQLKAGKSNSIGFLLLDVRNPFFTDVARGTEERAAAHGLTVLLANSDEKAEREAAYLDLFEQQRVQGVLVSPVGDVFARLERLHSRGITTVLVDRMADGRPFSSVSVDDVAGGYLAVSHLIKQGCRRIAYVAGPLTIRQVTDRLEGAHQAIAEAGGDVGLEVIVQDALTVESGRAAGAAVIGRRKDRRPDGLFCANDLIAVGVLQSFTILERIDIPGEIALIGYDDIDFASATAVPLSSIRQPSVLMGRTAVDLLLEQISRATEPHSVVFQPELVVRTSSNRSDPAIVSRPNRSG